MTDNQLFRILLPLIRDGLRAEGVINVAIKQQYQPTQQGLSSSPMVLLHKIGDYRYGYPQRKSIWDQDAKAFIHMESVAIETTFQFNALVPQHPEQPELPTASDVLNLVAMILQSDASRHALRKHEIGIYRVRDLRQIYFVDDRDQFAASPSFDFTLTHSRTLTSRVPAVQTCALNPYRT
ncbi:hypothetical protein [Mycoavidus sp. SF9855]|uniref:phage gateway protein n=1 Tax=Mycoavidus sp. SF9855 TaxID=2968475 RepID=UPI00211CC1B1|nr:hypothetical protein [Mycoavidus sp. SF9855]UUM20931.1 hypothetical protein NQD60_05465 [Mycoavidus sp. SF9855]